ncbi:hypothetical protein GCM10008944_21840 [Cytobacillus oceanisediminis]
MREQPRTPFAELHWLPETVRVNNYRRRVFKAVGLFLVVTALISTARANVGQPWSALLLALGFASLGVFVVTLYRIDRTRE